MNEKTNSVIGEFIVSNLKAIIGCVVFICGMYVQYQASIAKVERVEQELMQVQKRLDEHYAKLDNVKLDKAVFEATMKQFTDMSADIRQIREMIENKHNH